MKKSKIFVGCMAGVMALTACSDRMDYHEYVVRDRDEIIQTFDRVGGFMTDIYNHFDYDFGQYYSGALLGSASDESQYSLIGNEIEDFYNGAWSPTNAKGTVWSDMYEGIAVCNVLIDDFQDLTFSDLELNSDYRQQLYRYNNYQWEARFARAYFYFVLARQYGGVPLVTRNQSYDITNSLSRESSDSIFRYVISECDFIEDSNAEVPPDAASFSMLREQLDQVLDGLADRERKVIKFRFGLEDGHPRTLEEVGREFGVTRERIRQIESKTLAKLRHPSRSGRLKDYMED